MEVSEDRHRHRSCPEAPHTRTMKRRLRTSISPAGTSREIAVDRATGCPRNAMDLADCGNRGQSARHQRRKWRTHSASGWHSQLEIRHSIRMLEYVSVNRYIETHGGRDVYHCCYE